MNCVQAYFDSDFLHDDRAAIIFFKGIKSLKNPRSNISFSKLSANASKAQNALHALGFKKGDVILLFESPSPDMYAMIMAMLASGIKLMIVEPWMPIKNINSIIEQIRPKGFMSGVIGRAWGLRTKSLRQIPTKFTSSILHNFKEQTMKIESMKEDDEAILTFTSGTSGNPKGVHRKHKYLIDQASVLKKHMDYTDHPKMDLTIFTNVTLLNLGMGKGSLLVPPRWNKNVISELDQLPEQYQPDTLSAGPAFLIELMKYARVHSLASFHLGGALADTWIYEKAFKYWPKAKFTHVYGSSEAEPVALADLKNAVQMSKNRGYFQTLYLGRPIDDIEIDNSSTSLWVSGPHVSPEYKGDIEANQKNKRK
ncbi:MAG: AMP-binding protein, partial [Bacteriovoracaceae bacterium]|nr:AMP-binding protein [Bacteriovoracaceae bacterium]